MNRAARATLAIIVGAYLLVIGLTAAGYALGVGGVAERWLEAFAVLGFVLMILIGAGGLAGLVLLAIVWVSKGDAK